MYKFHYEHIKHLYPDEKSKLCFTDTDSFVYRLKSPKIYSNMLHHHELFDFSNFDTSHQCFNLKTPQEILNIMSKNKKVFGKELEEFVGLRDV